MKYEASASPNPRQATLKGRTTFLVLTPCLIVNCRDRSKALSLHPISGLCFAGEAKALGIALSQGADHEFNEASLRSQHCIPLSWACYCKMIGLNVRGRIRGIGLLNYLVKPICLSLKHIADL